MTGGTPRSGDASEPLGRRQRMKLSIRQGLLLFMAVASVLLVAMAGVGLWGAWRAQQDLHVVFTEEVVPVQKLILVEKQLTRVRVRMYGVLNDDVSLTGARHHLAEARRDIAMGWGAYREAIAGKESADERALIDIIDGPIWNLPDFFDRADAILAGGDLRALADFVKNEWWPLQLQINTPIGKLIALQEEHVAEAWAQSQRNFTQLQWGLGFLVLAGFALFFFFARKLFNHVTRKLNAIESTLGRVASGDLGARIGGAHQGEFGRIAKALDHTVDILRADREAIELLRQRQASILDSMVDGLYGTDAEGRIDYVNGAAERMLGWTVAEMMGQPSHALFHHTRADGSAYPVEECPMFMARARKEPCRSDEELFWRRDGGSFSVDFSCAPIVSHGTTVGSVVVFRDISARRAAEAERQNLIRELRQGHAYLTAAQDDLALKEEELRSLLEYIRDGVITIDSSGTIRNFNPAICTIFGQSREALLGQNLELLIPEEMRAPHAAGLARHAATGEGKVVGSSVELEGLRGDGTRVPIDLSITSYCVRDERYYSGIIRDISARKAADQALRAALDRAQGYHDVARAVIVAVGADEIVLMINREGCALLGRAEAEIVGQNWFDRFVPLTGRADLRASFHRLVSGGREEAPEFESAVVTLAGVRTVAWRHALLRDAQGRVVGALSSGQDVTERKAAEVELQINLMHLTETNRKLEDAQNQLLQSEKMASVGQLAAGVAHEINNPVGFINSNLGTLKRQVDDLLAVLDAYRKADPLLAQAPELLAGIREAAEKADLEFLREDIGDLIAESLDGVTRVRKIVNDLKDFSRVDAAEWHFANLETGLDSTLNIAWNEVKYKAEVRKEYAGLPEIECIASQLNQVFMNLLVNAAQAIETRGTITLRTGFDDDRVWVEVDDTGRGIAPANLSRVFEPFFTTKPIGKGTGLGLSLAYAIVQRHGGTIAVRSALGQGTSFVVSIPRIRSATASG